MRFLGAFLAVIVLILIAGALFVWSGVYNVAANVPHWDATSAVLEIARERSIDNHSDGISPPLLDDPKLLESGFHHFHPMCRLCHGSPGFQRREFAMGMYPSPPDLTTDHIVEEFTDAQLYWIVNNGLKMTGMPAFGPTHSEDELWGLVAVLKKLPQMTPEEYRAKVDTHKQGEQMGGHHHGQTDEETGGHPHGQDEQASAVESGSPQEPDSNQEDDQPQGTDSAQQEGHSHDDDHAH